MGSCGCGNESKYRLNFLGKLSSQDDIAVTDESGNPLNYDVKIILDSVPPVYLCDSCLYPETSRLHSRAAGHEAYGGICLLYEKTGVDCVVGAPEDRDLRKQIDKALEYFRTSEIAKGN
jgi:hypothetical protein